MLNTSGKRRIHRQINDNKNIQSVFENVLTPRLEKRHGRFPCQKPLEISIKLINLHSHPNHIVLIPFCGSGSEAVATQMTANLITFDIALLELTCLPALVHDLPLMKNIENNALENIVEIYNKSNKQIFIAIDKVNSYKKETGKLISDRTVLQLAKNKILFIKNWNKNL